MGMSTRPNKSSGDLRRATQKREKLKGGSKQRLSRRKVRLRSCSSKEHQIALNKNGPLRRNEDCPRKSVKGRIRLWKKWKESTNELTPRTGRNWMLEKNERRSEWRKAKEKKKWMRRRRTCLGFSARNQEETPEMKRRISKSREFGVWCWGLDEKSQILKRKGNWANYFTKLKRTKGKRSK